MTSTLRQAIVVRKRGLSSMSATPDFSMVLNLPWVQLHVIKGTRAVPCLVRFNPCWPSVETGFLHNVTLLPEARPQALSPPNRGGHDYAAIRFHLPCLCPLAAIVPEDKQHKDYTLQRCWSTKGEAKSWARLL